jgi:hypothetical protein
MKKPINEVERLKLIAGLINEVEYNYSVYGIEKSVLTEGQTKEAKADEAVKAEVKAKKSSEKKPDILHIDQANPYEYRHGLQHELNELGEYTDEALEKAKTTVLKNLAKDANFYSNLLNAEKSSYTFKQTETDKPGMQAKADGHLKKEAKKDEKANVKDNLGKKEEGSKKPKGVKVMPDKGVTGSEKTIKEGLEETNETDIEKDIKSGKIKPEEIKAAAEKAMKGDSSELAVLMSGIKLTNETTEKTSSNTKDKHARIKEALKKGLKEKILKSRSGEFAIASRPGNIQKLKTSGWVEEPGSDDVIGVDNPSK